MNEQPKSITLYAKDESANVDKVYKVEIIKDASGWTLQGWNGRRGNALNLQPKLKGVPYEKALAGFEKIVHEKMYKKSPPYHPADPEKGEKPAAEYQAPADLAERQTDFRPQLLNEITEDEIQQYIDDPAWIGQEKENGNRVGVTQEKGGEVYGANKLGLRIGIPQVVIDSVKGLKCSDIKIDGEMIGEKYKVYNLFRHDGLDYRKTKYRARINLVMKLIGNGKGALSVTKTAFTKAEKQALYDWLKANDREGMVFKLADSIHTDGRPRKGGDHLKCKFWSDPTSVYVYEHNDKDSVKVAVFDGKKMVPMGNVTCHKKYGKPPVGSVIHIIYLYAQDSFVQPKYFGEIRDDQDKYDCRIEQVKFRPEED